MRGDWFRVRGGCFRVKGLVSCKGGGLLSCEGCGFMRRWLHRATELFFVQFEWHNGILSSGQQPGTCCVGTTLRTGKLLRMSVLCSCDIQSACEP